MFLIAEAHAIVPGWQSGYIHGDVTATDAFVDDYPVTDQQRRETIILACISKRYFAEPLRSTGASPLLWTTGPMAPEAYTLRAALEGWVKRETPAAIDERAAVAYNTYQKCGLTGARRLFATGW